MGVSIDISVFRVRSLDKAFNEISWVVKETMEDLLDYTFEVLRSESPSGPFDSISVPFKDRYVFVDNALYIGDRWRKFYYQLKVTHVPTSESQLFGPVALEPEADLIAVELRRHMQLLFNEYAGRRCWVLPARTFGQRCECWSVTMGRRTRSNCLLCYDTGFVRGYLSPIEIWMQFDPSPKTEQTTNVGNQQQSNTTARLGHYPQLKPRDIVIESENRRWRVVSVTNTEHLRAPIHQEVQLHEIPVTDIEFAIALKMDQALRYLDFEPSRNYTMPTNFDNFLERELPGIFALYEKMKA